MNGLLETIQNKCGLRNPVTGDTRWTNPVSDELTTITRFAKCEEHPAFTVVDRFDSDRIWQGQTVIVGKRAWVRMLINRKVSDWRERRWLQ